MILQSPTRPLVWLAITLTAFSLIGCKQEVSEAPPIVRPIKILTIDETLGGRTLQYNGTIEAGEFADISFEVPGRIIELSLTEGQDVDKGELLARLDPADYQSRLAQAQADYDAAKAGFDRYQVLVERGTISRQDFEQQKRNYEVAGANLETANKALADTRLLAPFAGNVGRLYVRSFVNILAKQPILVLQDTESLDVVISVPEQDWSRARPNEEVEDVRERVTSYVTVSTFPDRQFPALLKEIAKVADPVTRTFEAKVTMQRPDDMNLLPGMTATVTVIVDGENDRITEHATMLPAHAVIADDLGKSVVWIVDPDSMTVSAREVTVADMAGSEIRVLSGLTPGDQVAVSGVSNLRDGMQVRELAQD